MSTNRCAVSSCRISRNMVRKQNAAIIFHTFPLDATVRSKWVQFCQRNAQWMPNKYSRICSNHFAPESYQMQYLPVQEKSRLLLQLRKLHANAIPSVNKDMEMNESEEVFADDRRMDSLILKFRDKFCRTCLKHCQGSSVLIPVDSQIQNTTLLDMLIQLTSFETDDNNAFPTNMCLECTRKLIQAFNNREEFITQSELLVRLVAEEKIIQYYNRVLAESNENSSDMKLSYSTCSKEKVSGEDSDSFSCGKQSVSINHVDTLSNDAHDGLSEMSDLIDHSCYTKLLSHGEDLSITVDLKRKTDVACNTIETEATSTRISTPKIKFDKSNAWEKCMLNSEQAKAAKLKLETEACEVAKSISTKLFKSKTAILEDEVRKSLPLTTCYVCEKKHDTTTECDFHMREHIHLLPYECDECIVANNQRAATEHGQINQPLVLKTLNKLNFHLRMHRMPHKCEKCYHRFSTSTKLKTHIWASHGYGVKGLTCEYCGKQYFHRTIFRTHVAHHRNELNGHYKCSICGRTFGVKSSLQRHQASHKGEKKYKCMYCDKSFSTSYNRLNHHRTHTGERPHKCFECGRAFAQSTTLLKHTCSSDQVSSPQSKIRGPALLTSKDGRCPYSDCDYTATTYGAMYAHKRTKHMPLYHCQVCSKSFAFAANLKFHMTLHTGKKPHRCKMCDRSFRSMQIYRRHLQTHRTDSSFVCEICQKSFKLLKYLQAHIQTHSSERKFSCETCGKSYKTKGELKKHNQSKCLDDIVEEIIVETEACSKLKRATTKEEKYINGL